MNTELSTIPQKRKVFYDTYANLPVAGLNIGDLGYATDRLVFYRWSGAAWQAITIHSSSGAAAAIPAAANLPNGSLYYETDTSKLKQIQAGAWAEITATPEYCPLEVADWLVTPATGTFDLNPDTVNDGIAASPNCSADAVNQYAEVDLKGLYKIKQWRQHGDITNNGDGVWKIEYLDENNTWHDWVIGIATRATADWSGWTVEAVVRAHKIRLTCTTVDSSTTSQIGELEVKY